MNLSLRGQELSIDFKNPFKIIAEREKYMEQGASSGTKNLNFCNWRYLLDKIRTFFENNPDFDN